MRFLHIEYAKALFDAIHEQEKLLTETPFPSYEDYLKVFYTLQGIRKSFNLMKEIETKIHQNENG